MHSFRTDRQVLVKRTITFSVNKREKRGRINPDFSKTKVDFIAQYFMKATSAFECGECEPGQKRFLQV